jgi:hypothetical protein
VREHYSPALKAWIGDLGDGKHDGGPEDPRIVLIRVKVATAQYALSSRSIVGQAVAMAKGVLQGEVPVINKLRQVSEQEIEECELFAGTIISHDLLTIKTDRSRPKA